MTKKEELKEKLHQTRMSLYNVRDYVERMENKGLIDEFMANSAELLYLLDKQIEREEFK